MQSKPKISVIVPVYNAEKYIKRCLESIYQQTFSDYEIILVNDGSTDQSLALCRKYAGKDERITVINKKNEGAGSARNAGIEVAKGDYLAFPDVDDWFEPEMYHDLYDLAMTRDYDIVFSGANFYSQKSDGSLAYERTAVCDAVCYTSQEECREHVMTFFPTSTIFDVPWNKLYKRMVAIKHGVRFSDTRRCQDAMFNIDFYNVIQSAAATDKAYYNYIQNTVESTQRKFPKNYIDINIAYFDDLISALQSWGIYNGDVKCHYDTSFVMAVYETMGMFENPNWKLSKQERKQYVLDILNKRDVQDRLIDAYVRNDAKKKAEIIKNRDYAGFMRNYQMEKWKNTLRKNRWLLDIYHGVKR